MTLLCVFFSRPPGKVGGTQPWRFSASKLSVSYPKKPLPRVQQIKAESFFVSLAEWSKAPDSSYSCDSHSCELLQVFWSIFMGAGSNPAGDTFLIFCIFDFLHGIISDQIFYMMKWGRGSFAATVRIVLQLRTPRVDGPRHVFLFLDHGRGERERERESPGTTTPNQATTPQGPLWSHCTPY